MIKYIALLFWVLVFYVMSWGFTSLDSRSVLITTGKTLNKILFFINPFQGISIVSIILGIFAHLSLMFLGVLVFFDNFVQPYLEAISWLWNLSGFCLLGVGETIETYIRFKRAKISKKRREFLGGMILLICSVGGLFYFLVRYGLVLCKLIFA